MHIQESLRNISKWGKFLGYVLIVTGVLSALSGLFAFLVGAVPGVMMVFLGLYILRSARKAEELQRGYEDRSLAELLENYAKFLRLYGIMMIIAIVLYGIIFAVWGVSLIAMLGSGGYY